MIITIRNGHSKIYYKVRRNLQGLNKFSLILLERNISPFSSYLYKDQT